MYPFVLEVARRGDEARSGESVAGRVGLGPLINTVIQE